MVSIWTHLLPSCASSARSEDDHFQLRGGHFPARRGSASMTVSTAKEKWAPVSLAVAAACQHYRPPPPQPRCPDFQHFPPKRHTGPGKGKGFLQEVLQPLSTFVSRLQFHTPNSFCNLLKVSSASVMPQTETSRCGHGAIPPALGVRLFPFLSWHRLPNAA